MDEEALNTSVRKFLKTLGVTAQREIEKAVRDADAKGKLKNGERLPAKAVVTVGGIDLKFEKLPRIIRQMLCDLLRNFLNCVLVHVYPYLRMKVAQGRPVRS